MNQITKITLTTIPALLMLACGGGGGGGSTPSSAGGGVAKGIIIGGEVNIFPIEEGAVSDTALTDAAITDANGNYSLTVPSTHDNSPVLLRLSMAQDATNNVTTQMKCDLPAGCGNSIEFGDLYTPDAGFVMEAILAAASGQISASITPLTDIGAKLAISRLSAGDDDGVAATVIDFANSQVANRFGLSGSLTDQEIIDITDPVAANTASGDALRNSALAAAIVAAVQTEQAGQTIEQALTTFVNDFVDGGVADKDGAAADPTTTTLSEVLEQATAVLTKTADAIEEEFGEGEESENFSSARTEVENDEDDANGDSGSTTASQGAGSPNSGADDLAKAKAFVQQLRDLGGNIEEGLEDGTAAAEQINMISELSQEDVDETLEITANVITAIVDANAEYDEADDEQKPSSYTSEDGIIVVIAESGDRRTYTVDQSIDSEEDEPASAQMVGVLDFSLTEDEGDNPDSDNFDDCFSEGRQDCSGTEENSSSASVALRELSVTGDVSFGNATLSILEPTDINATVTFTEDESFTYEQTAEENGDHSYSDEYESEISVTATLSFDFDVQLVITKIAQKVESESSQANQVTFTGGLSASLTGFELDEFFEESETSSSSSGSGSSGEGNTQASETTGDSTEITTGESSFSNSYEESRLSFLEFDLATLGLSGSVEDDLGNRASATVTVSLDGSELLISSSDSYSESSSDENGFSSEETSEGTEEDEDNFLGASIAVTLVADINGISDHTKLEFEASREEFDTVTASIRVEYGVQGDDENRLAQHIDIQAEATDLDEEADENGIATVTNQDGVIAELTNPDDELSGTIEVNGTTYATITPETIRFIDGTIESF